MVTATPALLPAPTRDHCQGSQGAPVALLEYGDYECPYCAAAHPIVKNMQSRLGEHLLFGFRHFPLTEVHPHAETAARLAEAAALQGQFWCVHDNLFANRALVVAGRFDPIVPACDLDGQRTSDDMASPAVSNRLREDFISGIRGGVNGTPTFFVNGARFDGSWQDGELERLLLSAVLGR